MNILIIGNINSTMYLNGHVKWLRKKYGDSARIDLFSTHLLEKDKANTVFAYNAIYFAYPDTWLSRIPFFKRHIYMRSRFLNLPNDYEILQIHFVFLFLKFIAPFFHVKATKVIASFWGSDFYKVSVKNRHLIERKILTKTDAITLGNPEMLADFTQYYQNRFTEIRLCYFGNDLIEIMSQFSMIEKRKSKAILGFDDTKITITISYNPSENNQHLPILKAIGSLINILDRKDSIELIVPLTYGGTKSYKDAIMEELNQLPFQYCILNSFLTEEKVFHLRNATDIFIHLPISDALSGSLREHFYGGNIVITGDWLPYKILDQNEIYYHSISNINQLPVVLLNCLENLETERLKCSNNPANIYKISSWNAVIDDWVNLYNNLLLK